MNERTLVERLLQTARRHVHFTVVPVDQTVRRADAIVGNARAVELADAFVPAVTVQIEAEPSELATVRCAMG